MNGKRNKTITASVICIVLMIALCMLAIGCQNKTKSDKLSVVCTVFPLYDWTSQIVGECDKIEVSYLAHNGEDMHSFQPGAEDMIKISDADVVVYIGGESEEWLREYLENNPNPERTEVCLFDCVGQNGILCEEEACLGDADESEEEDEEETEYDEHIYMSITLAESAAKEICDALIDADIDDTNIFKTNFMKYSKELDALDNEYKNACQGANKTMIIADRFPFLYLFKEYNLQSCAAFKGCSAETEADFATVTTLAGLYDESGMDGVFVTESSDKRLAQTVIDNSVKGSGEIYVLNSMQSVSSKDIEAGASYIGYMKSNLEVIVNAFK